MRVHVPDRGRVSLCLTQGSAHPHRGDRSPHGGQGQGRCAGNLRPSWALATPRGSHANAAPSGSPAPSPARARPRRAPHSGKPGLPHPPRPPASASVHLARLVELLLQPRHRHRASRRRPSRRDPANRRDNASDRHPGAADPPRASAGSAGAASTALSPAPRPPLRPPQPVARPRGQDITWQPHASGPACVRAPPAGVRALTHVACGASGRFCQRVGPGAPRAAATPAASPGVREVALMSSEM